MPTRRLPLFLGLSLLLAGASTPGEDWPPFVQRLIAQQESAPKKNPPGAIWRYEYRGSVVFYVPPSCCDVPSELYDSEGGVVCSPDGGMAGDGDGRCPDFFDARTNGRLVWSDKR